MHFITEIHTNKIESESKIWIKSNQRAQEICINSHTQHTNVQVYIYNISGMIIHFNRLQFTAKNDVQNVKVFSILKSTHTKSLSSPLSFWPKYNPTPHPKRTGRMTFWPHHAHHTHAAWSKQGQIHMPLRQCLTVVQLSFFQGLHVFPISTAYNNQRAL